MPDDVRSRILVTLALAAATVALLATAMTPPPAPSGPVDAGEELSCAIERSLADLPPPLPATAVGDHYYQWAHIACPTGKYQPPQAPRGPSSSASADRRSAMSSDAEGAQSQLANSSRKRRR